MKKLLFLITLAFSIPALAEEAIKVQATPKVQAVNLAPIETQTGQQQNVIQLKSQPEQVIKVQSTPVVPKEIPQTRPEQQVIPPTTPQTTPTVYKPPVQIVAPQNQTNSDITTPAAINIEACSRMFNINAENLFILALGAIEANNFEIEEIQSHNGYITFKAMNKEFLATIAEVDNKNSMIRINPTNGVYHFAPGIIAKVFEYIAYKLAK